MNIAGATDDGVEHIADRSLVTSPDCVAEADLVAPHLEEGPRDFSHFQGIDLAGVRAVDHDAYVSAPFITNKTYSAGGIVLVLTRERGDLL